MTNKSLYAMNTTWKQKLNLLFAPEPKPNLRLFIQRKHSGWMLPLKTFRNL